MNARFAIAAMFATIFTAATTWGQTWSVDPNTGRPYAGTITTTTITTYAPAAQETVNYTPETTYSAPVDLVPTYQNNPAPVYNPQPAPAPVYAPQPAAQPMVALSVGTPNYTPVNYVQQANYVAPVNYVQQVSYYRPEYARREYVRPAYYAPFYARPAYYAPAPVYRPVVTAYAQPYAPAYAPAPIAPASAYGVSVGATIGGGPQVWVHPKVYVQGEPIRNLIRAITP